MMDNSREILVFANFNNTTDAQIFDKYNENILMINQTLDSADDMTDGEVEILELLLGAYHGKIRDLIGKTKDVECYDVDGRDDIEITCYGSCGD